MGTHRRPGSHHTHTLLLLLLVWHGSYFDIATGVGGLTTLHVLFIWPSPAARDPHSLTLTWTLNMPAHNNTHHYPADADADAMSSDHRKVWPFFYIPFLFIIYLVKYLISFVKKYNIIFCAFQLYLFTSILFLYIKTFHFRILCICAFTFKLKLIFYSISDLYMFVQIN